MLYPLSILTAAADLGYSPWLIHDDDGHWAVCDDGMNSVGGKVFNFGGRIEPSAWHDTPEAAIEAYGKAIALDMHTWDSEQKVNIGAKP
jgi:hypothetical protein